MGAASRSRNRISPPTPGRCWRCKAAAAQGARLGGTLELHFTYDEEVGGDIGPKWLLDQGLTKPDVVIAAGFAYSVVTAHNGCLHLEVTVTGKQAHAAMPETGVDALEAATTILTALYAHRARACAHALEHARHRLAHAQRRADQGRHQHQRGARPGRVPHRPPHDSRRRIRPRWRRDLRALIAAAAQSRPQVDGRCAPASAGRAAQRRSPAPSGSPRRSSATPSRFSASTCR